MTIAIFKVNVSGGNHNTHITTMIDSSIQYEPNVLGDMLQNWNTSIPKIKKHTNYPVSSQLYQQLLFIMRVNGEGNTICFRYTVSLDIKQSKYVNLRLKIIKFINNNVANYPYFLASLLFVMLIPIIITFPIVLNEIFSICVLFLAWYFVFIVILVTTGVTAIIFVRLLRNLTPVRHPHILYLSLVHCDSICTSRVKIEFKDNESFYGKNNNFNVDIVINEGLFYNSEVTQQELQRILKTIQFAQLVQFV